VKFGRRKRGEIVRGLSDKQNKIYMALHLSLLRGLHPKSARASIRQFTPSAPDFIQIGPLSCFGGVIDEDERVVWRRGHRQNAP